MKQSTIIFISKQHHSCRGVKRRGRSGTDCVMNFLRTIYVTQALTFLVFHSVISIVLLTILHRVSNGTGKFDEALTKDWCLKCQLWSSLQRPIYIINSIDKAKLSRLIQHCLVFKPLFNNLPLGHCTSFKHMMLCTFWLLFVLWNFMARVLFWLENKC